MTGLCELSALLRISTPDNRHHFLFFSFTVSSLSFSNQLSSRDSSASIPNNVFTINEILINIWRAGVYVSSIIVEDFARQPRLMYTLWVTSIQDTCLFFDKMHFDYQITTSISWLSN